jgi:hypothetical protein
MDESAAKNTGKSKPKMGRSRRVPISINRRLVLDGLSFASRVPLYPAERYVDLSEVAVLRKQTARRISWAVVFMKAYGIVARDYAPLRQMYIRWPWPRLIEHPQSVGMVVVDRQYRGENRICWARLARPEDRSLPELQKRLDDYQTKPVEQAYHQQIRLSRMPMPLRRLIYWFNINLGGRKRSKRLGTFSMSTLAGHGVLNRGHQTFLTTSLTYGPLDEHGKSLVTLLCDHRVVDGVIAARALVDLEATLRGPIAEELKSLQSSRIAA